MNGEPTTEGALLDNWHLRMLNLEEDQDARSKNSGILRLLEDSSFLPNLHLDSSIQQYATGDVSPIKKWQSCEQLLRRDVEHFSETFFQLSPIERQRIHARLLHDAEHFPVLKRRLRHLAKGLELNPELPPDLSAETYRLRDLLLDLLTLAPRESARLRREWKADIEQDRSPWIQAVRELARHAPAIVQISPDLTDWIVTPPKPRRKPKPVNPQAASNGDSGSSSRGWVIALVLMFGIRIIAAVGRMDDHEPSVPDTRFLDQLSDQQQANELDEQRRRLEQIMADGFSQTIGNSGDIERETLRIELERNESFQKTLQQLPELQENETLDVESEMFSVTRNNDQLVIVFKDLASLMFLFGAEQQALRSPRLEHPYLKEYVKYCSLRDAISDAQQTPLLSVSGVKPPQRLFPLNGTHAIYLDSTREQSPVPKDEESTSTPGRTLEDLTRNRTSPAGDSDE